MDRPELYVVLLPDTPCFTIAAVSDAFLRATRTERNKLIGQAVFEVFPDNPEDPYSTGVAGLRACLDLVLRERISHALPLQRYAVQRPLSEDGGFEERYWSVLNTSTLGENGEVAYIVQHTKDVTEHVRLKEREKQERAARLQAEERIGGILDGMSDAFLVLDKEWRIRFMNREAARISGKTPEVFLGKTHWEEWPASVGTSLEAAYRRAIWIKMWADAPKP